MRGTTFAALAVLAGVSVLSACRGKEAPPSPSTTPPGPEPTHAPVAIEPIASPSGLKPGLKLTTFHNNKFIGPGETKGQVSTLGFPCDLPGTVQFRNPYGGKEVSLRYEGYLQVNQPGTYVFQILSDDQSNMKLKSVLLIEQLLSPQTKEGSAKLNVGIYPLTLDYQNNLGPACLVVKWSSDGGRTFDAIPASQLFRE